MPESNPEIDPTKSSEPKKLPWSEAVLVLAFVAFAVALVMLYLNQSNLERKIVERTTVEFATSATGTEKFPVNQVVGELRVATIELLYFKQMILENMRRSATGT